MIDRIPEIKKAGQRILRTTAALSLIAQVGLAKPVSAETRTFDLPQGTSKNLPEKKGEFCYVEGDVTFIDRVGNKITSGDGKGSFAVSKVVDEILVEATHAASGACGDNDSIDRMISNRQREEQQKGRNILSTRAIGGLVVNTPDNSSNLQDDEIPTERSYQLNPNIANKVVKDCDVEGDIRVAKTDSDTPPLPHQQIVWTDLFDKYEDNPDHDKTALYTRFSTSAWVAAPFGARVFCGDLVARIKNRLSFIAQQNDLGNSVVVKDVTPNNP